MQLNDGDSFGIPKMFYFVWIFFGMIALAIAGLAIWGAFELGSAAVVYLEANS